MAEFNVVHYQLVKRSMGSIGKPRCDCNAIFTKLANQYIAKTGLEIRIQKLNTRLQLLHSMNWATNVTFNLK